MPVGVSLAPKDQADLQVVTEFFFPWRMSLNLHLEACDNTYRTKLSNDAAVTKAEEKLPGLKERMVAAVVGHCREVLPGIVERHRAWAQSEVVRRFVPVEIARLQPIVEPQVQALAHMAFDFRLGDTTMMAVDRTFQNNDSVLRPANARVEAFFLEVRNQSIVKKITALQGEVYKVTVEQDADLRSTLNAAYKKGSLAANTYATEHGMGRIFIVD